MERGRGCPLTSLEPRTSDRALVLGEGFLGELARLLDLVEGFLGELKLVLELVEGFLEELKLVLVIVEFFCLLDQQLWLHLRANGNRRGKFELHHLERTVHRCINILAQGYTFRHRISASIHLPLIGDAEQMGLNHKNVHILNRRCAVPCAAPIIE